MWNLDKSDVADPRITDRVTRNVLSLCDFVLDTPGYGRGYTCSLAGMSSLGRSGRCIHTAETRPTGRSRGKSRRVSQKTDPRKNRAHRRNRPTPGFSAMRNRNGKPEQKPYGKPRSGICFVHECVDWTQSVRSLYRPSACEFVFWSWQT